MSRPVPRGAFHRWCRRCGWKGTYPSAGRADYAKRRHSCATQLARLERAERGAAYAARLAATDRTPRPCPHKIANHQHGTYACYTLDACRCLPCAAAVREYEQNRVRQQAYGRWDNYVDADPARQHVRSLMAQGMGLKRIVAVGGSSQGQLWKLLYGKKRPDGTRTPSKRLRKDVAERLLAVELDLADGAVLDEAESQRVARRLQALVALGWSMSELGRRLGVRYVANAIPVVTGQRRLTVSTAKKAEQLFEELSMTLPPETNQRQRISASRSRRYAREHGWVPPLALEDVSGDEPALTAVLDEQAIFRRMHGDKSVRLTKAEKVELVKRWIQSGRSLNEMERLTGVHTTRYATQEAS